MVGPNAYFQTSCTYDYLTRNVNNITFVMGMYVGGFLTPVAIICFCYNGIIRAVFSHHNEMSKSIKHMEISVRKGNQGKQQEIQVGS